jgi:hypothetical protein
MLLTKYYLEDQVKKDQMGMEYDTYRTERNACRIFMGKAIKKSSLGIPGCRWENDIKVALK